MEVGKFLCFASYDANSKQLLYSKYNFDFDLYREARNYVGYSKNQMFADFLKENNVDLTKPFVVKDELKQFFLPITQEIQIYFDNYNYLLYGFNNISLNTFVTMETIMNNEFEAVLYDYIKQIPSLCEFLHIDENNKYFSKYNFNFDKYSQDFNVHGSKICIFYDFMIRLRYLSGNVTNMNGIINIPNIFLPYFYLDEDSQKTLKTYLETHSVFSVLPDTTRNISNIDYVKYAARYNLNMNTTDAQKYYIKYGQFQQDIIEIVPTQDNIIHNAQKSICYVFTKNAIGTGFLFSGNSEYSYYNGVKQIYLVTCYHLIANENKDVIYATCYYDENSNIKLLFRIIAYDVFTDICVAVFDPYLDYNKNNFAPPKYDILGKLITLDIHGDLILNIGQNVQIIGNIGLNDNSSFLEGKIIDDAYSGNFEKKFLLSYPPCILANINISLGNSGSPIFIQDEGELKCVGMTNAKLGDSYQYSLCVSNQIFTSVIDSGIQNYRNVIEKYGNNNIEKVSYYIREPFIKKWLGCIFSYYNPLTSSKINSAFENFTNIFLCFIFN